MRNRNVELEILILKSGKQKQDFAQALHWHPSKVSAIISRNYKPTSLEKEDFARELGCRVDEAFPSGRKEMA
jgi:plasmid maintenance system antidote protein VapI|tara:strand:- start:170 stop:385 length:216 start_codon:yes stop_codon:yes gene_type:complete